MHEKALICIYHGNPGDRHFVTVQQIAAQLGVHEQSSVQLHVDSAMSYLELTPLWWMMPAMMTIMMKIMTVYFCIDWICDNIAKYCAMLCDDN